MPISKNTQLSLEKIINYSFKDKELLANALTHSSYSNEMHMKKHSSNERLEFLGDSVLELVTSEFVYSRHKDLLEGDLTKLRASLVCEQSLSYCAKELWLGKFLLLGKGEDSTGGRDRDSILSDALEAIIGAIYLDGGFTNAKEFITNNIFLNIENKKLFFDSKTILQEIVQSDLKKEIQYKLILEEGPDHNKTFTIAALIDENEIGRGVGKTKKSAEQKAAYKAILKLQKKNHKTDRRL